MLCCRGLLLAAARSKDATHFHWLASDGWGRQPHVVKDADEVAEGALTVELHTEPIPGFDAYMAALTPEANTRNPWFEEYWQETFNCSLHLLQPGAADYCHPDLRLGPEVGYLQVRGEEMLCTVCTSAPVHLCTCAPLHLCTSN